MSDEMTHATRDDKSTATSTTSRRTFKSSMMQPLLLVLFVTSIALTSIIALFIGHNIGHKRGMNAAAQASIDNSAQLSPDQIQALSSKAKTLESQLDTAKQERDISLNNQIMLRQSLEELEVANLQLKQINDVYASGLAQNGGLPLQVVGANIAPLPENAFEYRFDVALLNKNEEPSRLTPTLTLLNETSLVDVPLEPKTYTAKGITRIRGRFVMPDGFKPKQMKLNLRAGGQNIDKLYNWRLDKPVEQMPLSLAEVPEPDLRPATNDDAQ